MELIVIGLPCISPSSIPSIPLVRSPFVHGYLVKSFLGLGLHRVNHSFRTPLTIEHVIYKVSSTEGRFFNMSRFNPKLRCCNCQSEPSSIMAWRRIFCSQGGASFTQRVIIVLLLSCVFVAELHK